MERIVLGTHEIVKYRGKCPSCGEEQESNNEKYVDIL